MFSRVREALRSEAGTIASVYMLAAAILFVTAIGSGFTLGKYAQAVQSLSRCTNMTAKATMVYMQRQAPPYKGALTPEAMSTGTSIFNEGLCNKALAGVPLMQSTAQIQYEMVGPDTLLVTISQKVKGYFLSGFFPITITQQAVAYTYQYGGTTKSPIYDGTILPKGSAPVLSSGSPTGATPTPTSSTQPGGGSPSPEPSSDPGGGTPSSSPSPSPSDSQPATYDNPYPTATQGDICHATSNAKYFPYRLIGPASAGIISGHEGHTGGVYPEDNWGDIIPPMPAIGIEPLNWTTEGKAIWHNNCEIP